MIRILYIVSTLGRTGPTNQLFNIIKYLDRSRFEPCLVTLSPEPEDSRYKDFAALNVRTRQLNLTRIQGAVYAHRRIAALIEEIHPTLIHSHGFRADCLVGRVNATQPWVCTVHNMPQLDYAFTYGKVRGRLMTRVHISALRRMNLCMAVSSAVATNLMSNFRLDNVTEIDNGVDREVFYPVDSMKKKALRETLGLPADGLLWISSGNLSVRKAPIFLIDCWGEMSSAGSVENRLVLLGDGSLLDECRRRASQLPNVHVVGRVADVSKYLQAADYFVSASHAEGLPMAALEAMACGLPTLLSDIKPHREILNKGMIAGKLFCLDSKSSFVQMLEELVSRSRDEAAAAAVNVVTRRFDAEAMSEFYQQYYRAVVQ